MAKVLVVGGGFAGVVAAESLAQSFGSDHQITLALQARDSTASKARASRQ